VNLGLQSRVLILSLLVLGTSLSLAGWVLDTSFRASIMAGAEEQLRLVVYSIMGAVDENDEGLYLTDDSGEPRLSLPDSGLYARVETGEGEILWVSRSAELTGIRFPPPQVKLTPGDFRFADLSQAADTTTGTGLRRFHLSYAAIWEASEEVELLFRAAADARPFETQITEFRTSLWFGLAGVAAVLMLVQVFAIRVGLRPVRVMADEVADLEAGRRSSLSEDYPHELIGLANNLDRFIEHETASRARYRNALDDLAHSLKTPLAVIRNALGDSGQFDRPLLLDQLSRMETTVSHQLTRAASSGPVVVGHLVPVLAVAERLARALRTAFEERELNIEILGESEIAFRGDERDLLELLGNLLENACKYTHRRVRFEVWPGSRDGLAVVLHIDDDGPGIPEAEQRQMLARGARGDTALQGQGIGLSVVVELVSLYGGELELGTSDMGGARVTLRLPGQLAAGGE